MAQSPLADSSSHMEIEELDQANNLVATYVRSSVNEKGSRIDVVIPKNANSYAKSILNVFLPAGYPNSVTGDYLEYQIYDSLQAFSSSIAGMLSSRAVLEGIGVGDSHASPTAALLLSVLQESMGRIATILFAHRLGTALEPECKMYRLAADVFNDAAMLLDCLSPALPKPSRVVLLSLSSVLRALCGVAAGSSKASLSAHFATQGNLGELNAKDSSQETIISLLGMLAGSLVVSLVSSKLATWTCMLLLLSTHLFMNYLAVRAVCMRTLNRQRANLVFSSFIEQNSAHYQEKAKGLLEKKKMGTQSKIHVLTPEKVAAQERVFEQDGVLRWKGGEVLGWCKLGVSLQTILNCFNQQDRKTGSYTSTPSQDFAQLLDLFHGERYVMWYDEPRQTFLIVLKTGGSHVVPLRAWFHALRLARFGREEGGESLLEALERTRIYVSEVWGEIEEALWEARWDLGVEAMETRSGTRIRMVGAGDVDEVGE